MSFSFSTNEFGAKCVGLDELLKQEVDVIAPCALGAVFNKQSIPELNTQILAGGANNQLETSEDGQRLFDAGILYVPDYVINAGGIINIACEYYYDATDDEVWEQIAEIGPRLTSIFEVSVNSGRPTNVVADEMAREIIVAAS